MRDPEGSLVLERETQESGPRKRVSNESWAHTQGGVKHFMFDFGQERSCISIRREKSVKPKPKILRVLLAFYLEINRISKNMIASGEEKWGRGQWKHYFLKLCNFDEKISIWGKNKMASASLHWLLW